MDENTKLIIPKGYELKNIYHFETWDKDGNKTGEAYGDNIITSEGLRLWNSGRYTPGASVWLGTGTGTPKTTDTDMFSSFYRITSVSDAYAVYPQEYDSATGMITQKFRIYNNIVVPYNIDGVTTDTNITEFGLVIVSGTSTLCSHGLIKDEHGEPSYIVKRVNEQMTITVYLSASVHERFYQDLFDNGILGFMILRNLIAGVNGGYLPAVSPTFYLSGESFVPVNTRGNSPYVSYYGGSVRNGNVSAYGPNNGRVNRYEFNTPDLTIESSLHFETCANWSSIQYIEFKSNPKLSSLDETDLSIPFRNDEPESFEFNYCRTNGWNSEYFDKIFRITHLLSWEDTNSHGRIPIIDMSNLHSYMYNHIDKEWNIEEEIEYEPDVEWRTRNWHIQQQVYMRDPNGTARNVAVFTNDNVDAPIYAFNNSRITLYATDKWWDPNSWSLIEDLSNLAPAQRNTRYYLYIWSSDAIVLYPDRHWKKPKYVLSQTYNYTPYEDSGNYRESTTFMKCYSEALDVYCSSQHILFHPEGCWGAFDSDTNPGTVKGLSYKYPVGLTGLSDYQYTWSYASSVCIYHRWIINGFLILRQERGNASGYIDESKVHTLLRIIDINGYKNYAGTNLNDNATITDPTTGFVTDVQLELNNKTYNTAAELSIICDLDRLIVWESNAKQCLIVEIDRDENGKPVVTQTTLTTSATGNYDSRYLWYGKDRIILRKDFTYDIYSLTTKELLRSVNIADFDPSITSVSLCVGWRDLMYVTGTNAESNPRSLYYYNYETDTWRYRLNYYRDTIETSRMIAYNDECIIFSPESSTNTTASQPCIITANNPELYHAFTSYEHGNVPIKFIPFGDLKYLNDGKQLLMLTSVGDLNVYQQGYYKPQVWDIGYMIDNDSYQTTWCGPYDIPSSRDDFVGSNQLSCFFNGNIILRTAKDHTIDSILYTIIPITNLINHRITMTSRTISSFNQPIHFNPTTMLETQIGINEDYEPSPGNLTTPGKGSVYLVEIKESNDNDDTLTLVHRYIPCTRNSDNVVGVYDMIDQVFCKGYGDAMIASTDTVTNPEPNFPAEYTQAEFITAGTTSFLPLNYIHNKHTTIEWTGMIPSATSVTWRPLYGSCRWGSLDHSLIFYCYGDTNAHFNYRRNHAGESGVSGIYDKKIKATTTGLVTTVLDIDAGTSIAVTCNQGNITDEGVNTLCLFGDGSYTPIALRT